MWQLWPKPVDRQYSRSRSWVPPQRASSLPPPHHRSSSSKSARMRIPKALTSVCLPDGARTRPAQKNLSGREHAGDAELELAAHDAEEALELVSRQRQVGIEPSARLVEHRATGGPKVAGDSRAI